MPSPPSVNPSVESHEDRVERLFEQAGALSPGARRAFLEAATTNSDGTPDVELVAEIEGLLVAELQAERYFEAASRRLAGTADALTERAESVVGERIGPWRVGKQIGRGGMGTVYLAERDDGVFYQTAALKLVRPGLAPDLAERFRAERQILASLGHPGVAQLLGGGVTEDGRPWLAMEYVDGEPITAYCDRHQLGVPERLKLFIEMCDVVAYAHRNLVVHRDLKPSNVLVAEGGRRGQVKLLDFGVAKLLASGRDTPTTASGVRPYTPGYAAPEQILGLAVTTSADVYALGVLLYELLTGRRPHPMSSETPAVVERAVLESDPTRPSESLEPPTRPASGDSKGAGNVAALRKTTPQALRRHLQGDLDRIVLKALQREPEYRYGSAEALARDVQRHLDGLPVEARSASRWYRMNRFARRHRVGVAAGLLGVFALAAGLGLALWQGRVAAQDRDRAEQVAVFMTDLLGEFDPSRSAAGQIDAVSVLDQAIHQVESGLGLQPLVQARLYDTIGQIYQSYARFDEADRLIRRGLTIRRFNLGGGHTDVAMSLNHLAWLRFVQGDYELADSLYQESLERYQQLERRESVGAADNIHGLGLVRRAQGDPEAGIALVREALEIQQDLLPPDAPEIQASLNALASLLYNAGQYDEAAPLFEVVIAAWREGLGAHAHTAQALSDYGALLTAQDDMARAVEAHREALEIRREVFGDAHPHVAQSLSQLGWALQSQGRAEEAEPLYREALEIRRAAFGPEHTSVANSLLMLGEVRTVQGDFESGLRFEGLAIRTYRFVLGPDHPSTLSAEARYAAHLEQAGRTETARSLLVRAIPLLHEAFGADHEKTQAAEATLARLGG